MISVPVTTLVHTPKQSAATTASRIHSICLEEKNDRQILRKIFIVDPVHGERIVLRT